MPLWRNLIVQFQGLQPASSPTASCIHISVMFWCCSNWGCAEWQSLSRCNFLPLLYSDLTWQSAFLGAARTVHSFHDIGRDCSFHAAVGASRRFTVEQNVRFTLPSSSCAFESCTFCTVVSPFPSGSGCYEGRTLACRFFVFRAQLILFSTSPQPTVDIYKWMSHSKDKSNSRLPPNTSAVWCSGHALCNTKVNVKRMCRIDEEGRTNWKVCDSLPGNMQKAMFINLLVELTSLVTMRLYLVSAEFSVL